MSATQLQERARAKAIHKREELRRNCKREIERERKSEKQQSDDFRRVDMVDLDLLSDNTMQK